MHETASLRIEPLQERHAAAMLPVLQDERLYTYISEKRYPSVDALAARYRRLAAGSPDPAERWLNWILFPRGTHDGADTPVGWLQATVQPDERSAEVAYVIAPPHWRRGLGSEALGWLLRHLAAAHGVVLARAQVDARNVASIALARGHGFAIERTAPHEDGEPGEDWIFRLALEAGPAA